MTVHAINGVVINFTLKSSFNQKWLLGKLGSRPLKPKLCIDIYIYLKIIQHVHATEDVMVVVVIIAPFPTIMEKVGSHMDPKTMLA